MLMIEFLPEFVRNYADRLKKYRSSERPSVEKISFMALAEIEFMAHKYGWTKEETGEFALNALQIAREAKWIE